MPRVKNQRRPLSEEKILDMMNNSSEIDDLSDDPGDNFEQEDNDADNRISFISIINFHFCNTFFLKVLENPFSSKRMIRIMTKNKTILK